MAQTDFDDLLKRLPAIAKAVNAFTSETVQQSAFAALVRALGGGAAESGATDDAGAGGAGRRKVAGRRRKPNPHASTPEQKTTPRQTHRSGPSLDRNINLRPKGGKSFRDFATSKNPTTAQERNVVAVHWLKSAGIKAIGVDQVYTCYKDAGWRLPADLPNSLTVTATRKGWLNTADMTAITVTPHGENLVEHDLPRKKE